MDPDTIPDTQAPADSAPTSDTSPVDAAPLDSADGAHAQAADPAPAGFPAMPLDQAFKLFQRFSAGQQTQAPAPQAPTPAPPPAAVSRLADFESDAAKRASMVRERLGIGASEQLTRHDVSIVHATMISEAETARVRQELADMKAAFTSHQQSYTQATIGQRADTAFEQTIAQHANVPPQLRDLLANQASTFINQGMAPEQAVAKAFANAAPLLRGAGQPGRPTNAQRQIQGNAAAKAAIAVPPNGAGRLAQTPNQQLSDPKVPMAQKRQIMRESIRNIFKQTPS
jgi:hypothetical protein